MGVDCGPLAALAINLYFLGRFTGLLTITKGASPATSCYPIGHGI